MDKGNATGKIFGIILCVLSAAILSAILIFSADVRGYTKFLDKYYLSVQRGASDFSSNFADGNINLDDIRTALLNNKNGGADEDYFKGAIIKYKIDNSEKVNIPSAPKAYILNLTVTVSIDDESYKTNQELLVGKIDGKWKIIK